ncbi:uncharacterized protein LOC111916648 [Lactuca sativa]|uniref:uncharacterized protein LOC111916648 n=1 Tax=Lactuca sativa TaxID=4236 RepID=UPI0022B02AF0|nr:uncharacterized protein LOC111916648 [Lactuca sativa]
MYRLKVGLTSERAIWSMSFVLLAPSKTIEDEAGTAALETVEVSKFNGEQYYDDGSRYWKFLAFRSFYTCKRSKDASGNKCSFERGRK